jgi:hypothetical protein
MHRTKSSAVIAIGERRSVDDLVGLQQGGAGVDAYDNGKTAKPERDRAGRVERTLMGCMRAVASRRPATLLLGAAAVLLALLCAWAAWRDLWGRRVRRLDA